MKEKTLKMVAGGDNIVSVNDRARLKNIEKTFPNVEIIIGKVEPDDKPVKLDLGGMEDDRLKVFDAATDQVLGQRIDTLYKPRKEPLMLYVAAAFFLLGIAACFFVYNI